MTRSATTSRAPQSASSRTSSPVGRPRVDRDGDQAGAQRAEVGGDELDPVGQRDHDAVAGDQAHRVETGGDPVDLGVELGPGHPPPGGGLDERDAVGGLGGRPGQQLGEVRGHAIESGTGRSPGGREPRALGWPRDGPGPPRRRPRAEPATPGRGPDLRSRSTLAGEASAAAAEVETSLATPPDPVAAAFFDVDNTVMQGASIFHLARGLHRRQFFTTRDILGAAWKQAYFRLVGVEDPEHVADPRASALAFIEGHRVDELEELSEEIFDEAMAHRIWPGTRALAQLHLDQGQRVWLVTAAPVEIATIIARRLGLTGALGTVSEHVDGVYTGRLVGEMLHGPAKAVAVAALAEREGLDLARCSAYSDSYNDLPMLDAGRRPVRDQPRRPAARPRPRARAGGSATTAPGRKAARAGLATARSGRRGDRRRGGRGRDPAQDVSAQPR